MKSRSVWNRTVQLSFVAAILTLLGAGLISYRALVLSSRSQGWARHTDRVLEELRELVSANENIEFSSRGFVLTADKSYLEIFKANILREAQAQRLVDELTVDNLDQHRHVPALEKLCAQKIRFSESVIDLRRAQGMEAAVALIGGGLGHQLMGEIHDVVAEMQDEERRLLAVREVVATRQLEHTKIVLALGGLVGLLTAILAEWSVRRENVRRGRTEETLRGSEEKYRMLVDGVRDYAIFMLDLRGQIVSWNAGAEKVKGYKAEEIIGHNFSCFFPPEEIKQGRPEALLRLTALSGRQEEQGVRIRKDGSRFLANITFTALRDRDGNLQGYSEFSHDLSESKEAGAKYRGLLEAAPDAMVVVNQNGEIVLLNVQAEKQFGYRRDELVGQQVKNIIPEGFAERLIADGTRSASEALAQQIGTGIELSGRRKNGSEFPIEIMLSPLESAEGILVTAAIRNISTRKASEEHLLKTARELKRSNDELQQFAYVASHDLQEPLRMVASYTQLLAKRYKGRLDADADEFIAYAVDGSNRMQGLIQDLLVYSRAGANGKALREISSEDALKEALTNLRATIQESGAIVTHDTLPDITTDNAQLAQVFQNLVG